MNLSIYAKVLFCVRPETLVVENGFHDYAQRQCLMRGLCPGVRL